MKLQNVSMLTLDILISTIDDGIRKVPHMLLPFCEGVTYVVSMQYTDERHLNDIPNELQQRADVRMTTLQGKGLSRNRNHAIHAAKADVLLIADDDVQFDADGIAQLRRAYSEHPNFDVLLCQLHNTEGQPLKFYPQTAIAYNEARRQGYYPSSCDISMRRCAVVDKLSFDEHFGLGTDTFGCGEEDIWLHDAVEMGLRVEYMPIRIGQTPAATTGTRFLTDVSVQRAKGAVFAHCYGRCEALWRITKEALHYFVYKRVNPLPLLFHMWQGMQSYQRIRR